jgi:RNA polymerase sigma-70 factor (ECF subfamily)
VVPTEPTGGTETDISLIARVLGQDDRAAFASLVNRHQRAVRSLLRRLTRGDAALSDDLAQETFLRLYRNLHQYRSEARFSTWLYRVTYNVFLAHARKWPAAEAATSRQPIDKLNAAEPSVAVGRHAQQIDVARAIAQLDEAERSALIYCYFDDLSHEQAALALNIPLGTLKSRLLRARQKLKLALAAWQPGIGRH